jgi:hypothetical protein
MTGRYTAGLWQGATYAHLQVADEAVAVLWRHQVGEEVEVEEDTLQGI